MTAKSFLQVLAGKRVISLFPSICIMLGSPCTPHYASDKSCCPEKSSYHSVSFPEQAPKVIGSTGKVLKSGPNDRVFVYFADHGAPGIGLPSGQCWLWHCILTDT